MTNPLQCPFKSGPHCTRKVLATTHSTRRTRSTPPTFVLTRYVGSGSTAASAFAPCFASSRKETPEDKALALYAEACYRQISGRGGTMTIWNPCTRRECLPFVHFPALTSIGNMYKVPQLRAEWMHSSAEAVCAALLSRYTSFPAEQRCVFNSSFGLATYICGVLLPVGVKGWRRRSANAIRWSACLRAPETGLPPACGPGG